MFVDLECLCFDAEFVAEDVEVGLEVGVVEAADDADFLAGAVEWDRSRSKVDGADLLWCVGVGFWFVCWGTAGGDLWCEVGWVAEVVFCIVCCICCLLW